MTQQLSDQVLFEGASCDLICWAGGELFDPFAHGLDPIRNCTALDRAWLAHYRVDQRLWLDELMLDHALPGPPGKKPRIGRGPAINGVQAGAHPQMGFSSHYARLELALDFGGGALIGDGDALERPGRGSPPAWAYLRLRELVFVEGQLIEAVDRSDIAAALRERDALRRDAGQVMAYPAADAWRRAFAYDYGFFE